MSCISLYDSQSAHCSWRFVFPADSGELETEVLGDESVDLMHEKRWTRDHCRKPYNAHNKKIGFENSRHAAHCSRKDKFAQVVLHYTRPLLRHSAPTYISNRSTPDIGTPISVSLRPCHGRRQRGGRGKLPPVPMPCPLAAPSRREKKLYVPSRPFPSIVAA